MNTEVQPYEDHHVSDFNPNEHLIQIPNKGGKADYLPVQWRLVWFRLLCPQGTIDTEELEVDNDRECEAEISAWNQETRRSEKVIKIAKGYARYRAVVTDGKGGRASATKTERKVDFDDYVEKAETGAVGRALAMLGYGTQFAMIEFDEGERVVDAPVGRPPAKPYQERRPFVEADKPKDQALHDLGKPGSYEQHHGEAEHSKIAASMTDQQEASIRKLCEHLGRPMPEFVEASTYAQAKALIEQLSKEYREQRGQANGHQEPEPQYPVEIIRLLSEFKELEPAWCNQRSNWDRVLLTKVLELQTLEPFPVIFDEDDINRVELYVESVRRKKAKVSAGAGK